MIHRNTVTQNYQLTVGEYAEVSVGFVSDEVLTDKVVKFNPGLYTVDGAPKGTAFQLKYPAAPGRYLMQKVSCKNYRAYIDIISPYRFNIEYHFIASKNISGWLPDAPFALHNALDTNSFSADLGFYIKVHDEAVVANVPVDIRGFCDVNTIFLSDDFIPGQDLAIDILIPNVSVSNNCFMALVKDNIINQVSDIIPGLIMSYATVGVGSIAYLDIPNLFRTSSQGFANSPDGAKAKAVINGNYLLANGVYRLYVVYHTGGAWHSCISEPIRQKTNRLPIVPLVDYEVSDKFSNTATTSCCTGLTNFRKYDLKATLDLADYVLKLTNAGYAGIFTDFYKGSKAFIGLSANAKSGIPINLTANPATGVFSIADFQTNKKQAFVIIQITMLIAGVEDVISIVYDLSFNAAQLPYDYKVYDSIGLVSELCDGEDYIGNKLWDCDLYQSIDGSVFSDNTIINGLDIDMSKLPFDSHVCFKAVCDLGIGDPSQSDCDCDGCDDFAVKLELLSDNVGIYIDITPYAGTIQSAFVMANLYNPNGSPVNGSLPYSNEYIGSNQSFELLQIRVTLTNGCKYLWNGLYSINQSNGDIIIEDLILGKVSESEDCDCPDPLVCDNYAAFEVDCDPLTQEVTTNLVNNSTSPIDTEEDICSLDGGLTFISRPATISGKSNVYLKYTATFTDGCPPLSIEQVVECGKKLELLDERTLELSVNGDGELEIDIDTTFGNPELEDILYVSLDGGETWQEFDLLGDGYTPIKLTGTEDIIAYTNTSFDAITEDVIAQGRLKAPIFLENCEGYDSYGLTATYDDETGTFEVTKTGDENDLIVNDLLWTLNSGDPLTGGGIPYFGAFVGEGLYIAAWRIQLKNCTPKTIYTAIYGKRCVEICNLSDIPMPQTTLISCCDGCPQMSLAISCIDRTLTITGVPGGVTVNWTGPNGFTGTGLSVSFPKETPSGQFVATFSYEDCSYQATYNYTKPNAGAPVPDPIIV